MMKFKKEQLLKIVSQLPAELTHNDTVSALFNVNEDRADRIVEVMNNKFEKKSETLYDQMQNNDFTPNDFYAVKIPKVIKLLIDEGFDLTVNDLMLITWLLATKASEVGHLLAIGDVLARKSND